MIQDENIGDNKEFAIGEVRDVTVHIGKTGFTSVDDTESDVYFNVRMSPIPSARRLFIRNDKTIKIVSMGGITFTDPVTVIADKGHKETFGINLVHQLVIRTTATSTAIKIRIK